MTWQDDTRSVLIPDFCGVSGPDEIQRRFYSAARAIMLTHDLVRDGYKPWQITALELYLYEPNIWPDPSTHGSKKNAGREQLLSGHWYVHQRGHKWRAPQRSGLDITCGSETAKIHAGLLIRAICAKDGPAIALQTIVRGGYQRRPPKGNVWKTDEHDFLDSVNGKNVFLAPLRLVSRGSVRNGPLWIGPRIFKSKSSKPPAPFGDCPLRVATWPMEGDMMKMENCASN